MYNKKYPQADGSDFETHSKFFCKFTKFFQIVQEQI